MNTTISRTSGARIASGIRSAATSIGVSSTKIIFWSVTSKATVDEQSGKEKIEKRSSAVNSVCSI